jgi:hypothetical protein
LDIGHFAAQNNDSAKLQKESIRIINTCKVLRAIITSMSNSTLTHASPRLLPVKGFAAQSGFSLWTIRQWAYSGRIASVKLGKGRLMIPASELDRLISENLRPALQEGGAR